MVFKIWNLQRRIIFGKNRFLVRIWGCQILNHVLKVFVDSLLRTLGNVHIRICSLRIHWTCEFVPQFHGWKVNWGLKISRDSHTGKNYICICSLWLLKLENIPVVLLLKIEFSFLKYDVTQVSNYQVTCGRQKNIFIFVVYASSGGLYPRYSSSACFKERLLRACEVVPSFAVGKWIGVWIYHVTGTHGKKHIRIGCSSLHQTWRIFP
jgi:hypothetical protein